MSSPLIRASLLGAIGSALFVSAPFAQTEMDAEQCTALLASLEEGYGARETEYGAALKEAAGSNPLILNMKDGSTVDLRGEDVSAGPTENWFGDPPRRKQVGDALTAMRSFNDSGDAAGCLEAARGITALLREWGEEVPEIIEASVEEAQEDAAITEGDATGSAEATEGGEVEDGSGDGSSNSGASAQAAEGGEDADESASEAQSMSADAGDGGAASGEGPDGDVMEEGDQSRAEAASAGEPATVEEDASQDDTGEGDNYGAPEATATVDPTAPVDESTDAAVTMDQEDEADAPAGGTEGAPAGTRDVPGAIRIETPDGREVTDDDPKVIRRKVRIEDATDG